MINHTREPLPPLIVPPQALNKLSISLQAIAGLTGSVKIAMSVLRWLLFIRLWYYFLVISQAPGQAILPPLKSLPPTSHEEACA
jgi:hypothetical protein